MVTWTSPVVRDTTPCTAGRSPAKSPWPRFLFARLRGGSAGSACLLPFFPRVLVHLVGLVHRPIQLRALVVPPEDGVLELAPEGEQPSRVALEFLGELACRDPLEKAAHNEHELAQRALAPVEQRAGEDVENLAARLAVEEREVGAPQGMNRDALAQAALGAGWTIGAQNGLEPAVALALGKKVGDGEDEGQGRETSGDWRASARRTPPRIDANNVNHILRTKSPDLLVLLATVFQCVVALVVLGFWFGPSLVRRKKYMAAAKSVSNDEFCGVIGVAGPMQKTALEERAWIAKQFGLPTDQLSPHTLMGDLIELVDPVEQSFVTEDILERYDLVRLLTTSGGTLPQLSVRDCVLRVIDTPRSSTA